MHMIEILLLGANTRNQQCQIIKIIQHTILFYMIFCMYHQKLCFGLWCKERVHSHKEFDRHKLLLNRSSNWSSDLAGKRKPILWVDLPLQIELCVLLLYSVVILLVYLLFLLLHLLLELSSSVWLYLVLLSVLQTWLTLPVKNNHMILW